MALPHLTDDQIRDWTREQKDRWWFQSVFRGDMPQLTLRAAATGFLLGGVLSATNLYVAAKTGWTLGVGLTSVILAFAMFRILSRLGARDMTILENNCTQSIATAAGYMTMPLTSGIAAYMWATNAVLPWWQIMCFNVVLSSMGVLVAFPMKRRFINDEQHPFPEGRACGVVLDALYESAGAAAGMYKARVLAAAAGIAGTIGVLSGENIMRMVQQKWLGLASAWHLPLSLDGWYYALADRGLAPLPRLAGVDLRQLALSPSLDLAMIGAGGLMGIRTASSLLVGAIVNFAIIVPIMITAGQIVPRSGTIAEGTAVFGRAHILNTWSLWWGITMMVVAAMVTLFARPDVFVQAWRMLIRRGPAPARDDVLRDIELPLKVSVIGVPLIGAVGVYLAQLWFGVPWWLGAASIPLILLLALIAASSTALTGITPSSSLSKIPQFIVGAIEPRTPAPNLMTAVMSAEVASNASNLLMDIKPGYMLGAKPRQQGDRSRHRHRGRRARSHPALLPVVRSRPLRARRRGERAGHDGERQVCVSGRRSVERCLGPRDDNLRRRLGSGTPYDVHHLVDGNRGDCGAVHGGHARAHAESLPALAARNWTWRRRAARVVADDVPGLAHVLDCGPCQRQAARVGRFPPLGGFAGGDLRRTDRRRRADRDRRYPGAGFPVRRLTQAFKLATPAASP